MQIVPISLKESNRFVEKYHRHHKPTTGHKFSIGLIDGNQLVGVAICGRPVSRYYDNGYTLEINRLCTNGAKNACSMLYSACVRIAKNMGYYKVITYILESENGASLRASNFTCEGTAGGMMWTGERALDHGVPKELKKRYVYIIKEGDPPIVSFHNDDAYPASRSNLF